MYIDARKITAEKMTDAEIDRDKKFTIEIYKDWFESNATEIAERVWEIKDIGVAENVGEFFKLIKEAEMTYSLGAMQSSIALIGIAAEDFCRFFANLCSKNMDKMEQFERINELYKMRLITDAVKKKFHEIRKLRNDCLHYNASFKAKPEAALKADAILALNTLKEIYAEIIGVTTYSSITPKKLNDVISAIVNEAAKDNGSVAGILDAQLRVRNVLHAVTGFNLSLDLGGVNELRGGIYQVKEIDIDCTPPEITLRENKTHLIVIVDLDEENIKQFAIDKLSDGDMIFAFISSTTDSLGMTSSWRFLSSPKKLDR
jgi:hypothetical protein